MYYIDLFRTLTINDFINNAILIAQTIGALFLITALLLMAFSVVADAVVDDMVEKALIDNIIDPK